MTQVAQQSMKSVNGVNVTQLFETIDAIKGTPAVAKFRFRAHNEWLDGGHNRTTIGGFYGAQEQHTRQRTFVLDADEPPILLGSDRGANPVEHLLNALASCVMTSIVYHAAARDIELQEVELRLEGDLDLHGFLGMDPNVRRGYQQIRIKAKVKADAPPEKLDEIVQLGPTYSPVFDVVTNGTSVLVERDQS